MRRPFRLTVMAAVSGIAAGAFVTWSVSLPGQAAQQEPRAAGPAVVGQQMKPTPPAASPAPSLSPAPPPVPPLVVTGAPRNLSIKAGALEDAATGTVVWNRGLNTELPMGSITKVMTALVVIDSGSLSRQVQVPAAVTAYVSKYGGNSAGLKPGDTLTAQELLEALLLPSGCDAAYALAVSYGPGLPAFLTKMNAMARKLGMRHTHFTSPDGLPYPTETSTFSTPADLITLGAAAMAKPVFRQIVAQKNYTLPAGAGHQAYSWANDNGLIGSYAGADGIKTGFTNTALHCLLFQATRNGLTLLGVVLGAPATGPQSGAQQASVVLNWGFGLKRR